MTIDEFCKTGFSGCMWCIHKGVEKFVVSAHFSEYLFGLLPASPNGEEHHWCGKIEWVRCEEVASVTYKTKETQSYIDVKKIPPVDIKLLDSAQAAKFTDGEGYIVAINEHQKLLGVVYELSAVLQISEICWHRMENIALPSSQEPLIH